MYILALLRRKNNLGATDLARRCGVSRRTILRDISTISSANIPIFYDAGYQLLHEDFLPPMSFSTEERKLLMDILDSYARLEHLENGSAIRSIKDKLETSAMLKSGKKQRAGIAYLEMR